MEPKFQSDYYFNQIYQIRQMALYFGLFCLCVFMYLDTHRFSGELLKLVLQKRALLQLVPLLILTIVSYRQKSRNIHTKQYYLLSSIVVIIIAIGHAEILVGAYEQNKYFPKVGMAIILFYAGILLALPIKISAITCLVIVISAAYEYNKVGMPYEEVLSITVFYGMFAACCVFMNYVCTQILRNNLRLVKHIDNQARTDNLTKIYNRRHFFERSTQIQKQAIRENAKFAVLLVDLDNFKMINDILGHHHGDQALIKVAKVLKSLCRRPLDLSARFGGDEFVMLLYDCDEQHIRSICTQIIKQIEQISKELCEDNQETNLGVSIGVIISQNNQETNIKSLIHLADEALYEVKNHGKNAFCIFRNKHPEEVNDNGELMKIVQMD